MNAEEVTPWYYRRENVVYGPISLATLYRAVEKGRLAPNDFLRNGPGGDWVTAVQMATALGDPVFTEALMRVPLWTGDASTRVSADPLMEGDAPSVLGAVRDGFVDRVEARLEGVSSFFERIGDICRDLAEVVGSRLPGVSPAVGLWGLGILVLMAAMYWGGVLVYRSHFATSTDLASLETIYMEFCELRNRHASQAEFDTLAAMATERGSEITRRLARRANSADAGSLDILFASRDFLPTFVTDARQFESKAEAQFRKHLQLAGQQMQSKDDDGLFEELATYVVLVIDGVIVLCFVWYLAPRLWRTA